MDPSPTTVLIKDVRTEDSEMNKDVRVEDSEMNNDFVGNFVDNVVGGNFIGRDDDCQEKKDRMYFGQGERKKRVVSGVTDVNVTEGCHTSLEETEDRQLTGEKYIINDELQSLTWSEETMRNQAHLMSAKTKTKLITAQEGGVVRERGQSVEIGPQDAPCCEAGAVIAGKLAVAHEAPGDRAGAETSVEMVDQQLMMVERHCEKLKSKREEIERKLKRGHESGPVNRSVVKETPAAANETTVAPTVEKEVLKMAAVDESAVQETNSESPAVKTGKSDDLRSHERQSAEVQSMMHTTRRR